MAAKQFVVTGTVRLGNGNPALKAIVKAVDKDLRQEQLLGEDVIEETAGRFQITYTAEQFRRAEKRAADLIVRAYDEDGNLRAESNIIFNAPETVNIALTFEPLPAREFSEYERLLLALRPVLEGVDPAGLTENDIVFLVGETRQPRQQIEFLQHGARLERETRIPTAAFYGWARRNLPLELNQLLNETPERLRQELATAIRERIIPDITKQFSEIFAQLSGLKLQRGLLLRREFSVQLLDQATGDPLTGYTVRSTDLDATPAPAELGSAPTDGRGLVTITYFPPRASSSLSRRLQLTIVSQTGEQIDQIRLSAEPEQKEPRELRISLPAAPDLSPRIDALSLPADLAAVLREKRISTLADLRRAGGARGVGGLELDSPEVKRLDAHARLSALSDDAGDQAALIAKGFDGPLKIAAAPRAEFVKAVSGLGDFKAAQLQAGAIAQVKFLNNAATAFLAEKANGQAAPGAIPGLGEVIDDGASCHCEDCEAAVSPAAYLADLLDYAVNHIKLRVPQGQGFEYQPINLSHLDEQLHQRFRDLPANCEAVEEGVRQVRICCEVLRRLIAAEDPGLPIRTRPYLEAAYHSLLNRLGSSYEELRDVVTFGGTRKGRALADRLGVLPEHLDALFTELDAIGLKAKLTEPWLEEHFGLVSTLRDPLAQGATPLVVTWRLEYLRATWREIDFPVAVKDAGGLPLIDPDLLAPNDIIKTDITKPPYSLWKIRTEWVNDRLGRLETLREQTAKPLAALDAMLTDEAALEMTVLGLNVSDLHALAELREHGESITPQLQQIPLENGAFNYLLQVIDKLEAGAEVSASEWRAVDSILVQVAKRGLFDAWRKEEREAGLFLGPDFFHPPDQIPIALPEWRATTQARREWETTLQSRIDQANATISALREAVSATEEATLALLRDALIEASGAPANTRLARTKWITDRLLIDAGGGACRITTRIAQAIETAQSLLWQIRTGQLTDSPLELAVWALDADNFDEEWKWIGSYATWRSAMFVFLYPENLATPNLRSRQTPAFRRLVETARNRSLTPEAACRAANEYAAYFKDICRLSIEASCYARTRVHSGENCRQKSSAEYRRLNYQFARSQVSKKVYWSSYDFTNHSGYAQTFWDVVPSLENVSKIVGAVPYAKSVFLIVEAIDPDGVKQLIYTRYDLERLAGWDVIQQIELPDGVKSLSSSVVAQRVAKTHSPLVAISGESEGELKVFFRRITLTESEAKDDDDETEEDPDWTQLALASPGPTFKLERLLGLFRFKQGYCLVAKYIWDASVPDYRLLFFSPQLNEPNHFSSEMLIGSASWRGGWLWPNTDGAVFIGHDVHFDTPRYYAIEIDDDFDSASFIPGFGSDINFGDLGRIAAHCDDDGSGVARNHAVIAYSTTDGLYLSVLQREPGEEFLEGFRMMNRVPLAPQVNVDAFEISTNLSEAERFLRIIRIWQIFTAHQNSPESIKEYLWEAYYFVPVHLALQLQQAGHYTAALDWLRTVYDYSLSPNQRKICYGLKAEESLSQTFSRAKDWLLDPLNPHAIAATRANTYTRFTLLAIIKCLLDYADDEFSRDTAESVPRARTLYTTALELLNAKELKQKKNGCDELIGSLEIEVGEPWKKAWEATLVELNTVKGAKDVSALTATIKALAGDAQLDDEQKIFRINSAIAAIKVKPATLQTIAGLTAINHEKTLNVQAAMLADPLVFKAAIETAIVAKTHFLEGMTSVTGLTPAELETGQGDLTWLREPASALTPEIGLKPLLDKKDDSTLSFISEVKAVPSVALNTTFGIGQDYLPAPSFGFCIPPNPTPNALRMRAELNLLKLRQCRNIAGVERLLEPYAAATDTISGMPIIGAGGQLALPALFTLKPTPYRYQVLVERAKELVQMAGQIEGAMLAALEKRDAEAYQELKARQELNLAQAGIQLQNLRLREARSGVTLAELQRDRAQIQVETYQDWIDTGLIEAEQDLLDAYATARDAQLTLSRLSTLTQIANAGVTAATADYSAVAAWSLFGVFTGAALAESGAREVSIHAESAAQVASFQASYERRLQEWEFQQTLATQDVKIGNQQIQLANDHVDIVGQEREISVMQTEQARETLDFLTNKFTNVELYDWMSGVLEGVFSFFLQRATAMAKLAENQLAFERQEITPAFIKSDYWQPPAVGVDVGSNPAGSTVNAADRRGLTGSARLLQDLYQLDQYSFETDRRKLQLTRAISLARMAPLEFQRFRETGVMTFATPMELFDRDFPGHYLRLIKQVRTSVIALIPPSHGVKATLSSTGASRVVIGGDVFQTVYVNRGPESIALSSPLNATGLFELNTQPEMLLPFEGVGVDTTWEFSLSKMSNSFDYSAIADVLITIDYTALNSYDYKQQALQQLSPSISADRGFSFRREFADAWYDLNNPDQTAAPMVVRFRTLRQDFPANLADLRIQHVALYFARHSGSTFEVPVAHLHFIEQPGDAISGGSATSIDAVISTRRGNAAGWIPMIGRTPIGEWELAFPNTDEMRNRFRQEEIDDILLVVTYAGLVS